MALRASAALARVTLGHGLVSSSPCVSASLSRKKSACGAIVRRRLTPRRWPRCAHHQVLWALPRIHRSAPGFLIRGANRSLFNNGAQSVSSSVGWSASRWFEPQSAYLSPTVHGGVGHSSTVTRIRSDRSRLWFHT